MRGGHRVRIEFLAVRGLLFVRVEAGNSVRGKLRLDRAFDRRVPDPPDRYVPYGRLAALLQQCLAVGRGHSRLGGNRILIARGKRDGRKRGRNETNDFSETELRDAIIRRCRKARTYCTTTKRHC